MPESVAVRCKQWIDENKDILESEGVDLSKLSLGGMLWVYSFFFNLCIKMSDRVSSCFIFLMQP